MLCVRVLAFLLATLTAFSTVAQVEDPADIPVEEFAALRVNSGVRLSPNGENVLIITKYQGERVVLVKPLARDGKFEGMAFPAPEDMDIRWAKWANDEYILVSFAFEAERHSVVGKQTETRLFSIPIDNPKKATNMAQYPREHNSMFRIQNRGSEPPRGAAYIPVDQDTIVDILPEDPEHFLLAIDEDYSDWAVEVRRVNVKNGNYRLVHDPSGSLYAWTTDRQRDIRFGFGQRYAGANLSDVRDEVFYRNPETGNWVDYSDEEVGNIEDYKVLGFYENPQYAFLLARNDQGFWALYKYDMIALETVETILSFEDRGVAEVITDPFTDDIVGAMYYGDEGEEYVYFDETYKELITLINQALPNSKNTLTSRDRAGTRFIVFSFSDIDSGSYYLFDKPSMRLIFLEAAYKGLDPRLMSRKQSIKYEARDGLVIHGYLTIPKGKEAKNLPAVVLPHGGPTSRDYWRFDEMAQFFASRGYAVLQPNFRGSTGYGKAFQDAGKREWGLKMQDDITDGAMWLIENGIADPERMCIVGWSYGGYAALTATIKTPDLFKCSASINGISDLQRLVSQESGYLGLERWAELIGDPGDDKTILRETSAYHNTEKIKAPILLVAAKDDTTVNYRQSTHLYKKLKGEGKPVEYIEIEDGNHSLMNEPARLTLFRALESFVQTHLGG